jgi:hypothetical protein
MSSQLASAGFATMAEDDIILDGMPGVLHAG